MDVKNAPAGPNLCRGIFYVRFFDSHQSNVSTTFDFVDTKDASIRKVVLTFD